jgi:hypothetical protein
VVTNSLCLFSPQADGNSNKIHCEPATRFAGIRRNHSAGTHLTAASVAVFLFGPPTPLSGANAH